MEWSAKVSKKYVPKETAQQIHDKAKPFVDWLKEASEEESEDGSDIDIEYSDRPATSTIKPAAVVKEQKPKGAAEEEDDIDIDDI